MADDKRNRGDQPQGGNPGDRTGRAQRPQARRRHGVPGSGRARKEDEEEPQE